MWRWFLYNIMIIIHPGLKKRRITQYILKSYLEANFLELWKGGGVVSKITTRCFTEVVRTAPKLPFRRTLRAPRAAYVKYLGTAIWIPTSPMLLYLPCSLMSNSLRHLPLLTSLYHCWPLCKGPPIHSMSFYVHKHSTPLTPSLPWNVPIKLELE